MHRAGGDHRLVGRRWAPPIRTPVGWRDAIAESAGHHEDKIDRRHDDQSLPDADAFRRLEIVHQPVSQGRANHGAAAEAHDRHAGGHAATIREPFDQGGDRRDVAEAKTDAANDASAQPHQPELVRVNADCRDNHAATPADSRDNARLARTGAFKPAAPDRGGDAEQDEVERIHPAEIGDAPVAGRREQGLHERHALASSRRGDADGLRQGQPEHREAVSHADAEMDGERRRRDQPTVETGFGDDPFAVKQSRLPEFS